MTSPVEPSVGPRLDQKIDNQSLFRFFQCTGLKSKLASNNLSNLAEIFVILREHWLKLRGNS